jgi:1-acyl-sn-glycerol-3-phosphate acyltransferase
LYQLFKPVVGVALRWYYRSITTAGLERIPRDGPVFLAVNHPNALVDALVVGWCTPRPVRFTAKATIFANALAARFFTAVGVVPLRRASDERTSATSDADPSRNAAAFDAVAQALRDGGAVVIFPEGRSHDDPHLAPLRSGLARMALHAAEQFGVTGMRIVPVGLLFERKEAPRSRVLLQVGEPIDVDALVQARASVGTVTQLVSDRLAAVTLNFDNADDADRLQTVGATVAALLEPPTSLDERETPLASTLTVLRRLDRSRRRLLEQPDAALQTRADDFEQRVRAFRATLAAHRLDVHDIGIAVDVASGTRFVLREAWLAALLAPIGLWGRLTHFVPIQLARRFALRNTTSRDEPAMNTLIFGLVLVLLAYAVQTTLVGLAFGGWWALAFFVSLVPSASSDLRYGDRLRRARSRVRAFLTFRRNSALQHALRVEADHIRREAGALEQAVWQ